MIAAGLEYETRGAGETPVICLHGIGGNTASFAPQLSALSADSGVICVNLPGYGASKPLEQVTFPNLAAQVIALMDALGIKRAHLCGQSIGGMIALEAAILYADRVASLALIATTSAFGGRDDSFKDAFVAARLAPLDTGKTLADLAKSFVPEIVGPIAAPETIAAATASMAELREATYRRIIACLVTFDRRTALESLSLPACLIAGSADQNAPARTMERMAAKIKDAEYHVIEGAGHLVNLEAPDRVNDILSAFYGRIS
jgi:pimeloyl-ACP methyl ester carboxylesterase